MLLALDDIYGVTMRRGKKIDWKTMFTKLEQRDTPLHSRAKGPKKHISYGLYFSTIPGREVGGIGPEPWARCV